MWGNRYRYRYTHIGTEYDTDDTLHDLTRDTSQWYRPIGLIWDIADPPLWTSVTIACDARRGQLPMGDSDAIDMVNEIHRPISRCCIVFPCNAPSDPFNNNKSLPHWPLWVKISGGDLECMYSLPSSYRKVRMEAYSHALGRPIDERGEHERQSENDCEHKTVSYI